MQTDLVWPLVLFVLVTAVTPGPNNIMLLGSGLNHGVGRSLPHLFGVSGGFAFMTVVVGLGLGAVFERLPQLYVCLKYAGAAYMLYLAWTIARAGPHQDGDREPTPPLTFLQAALFQWVNPKGWVMAVGAISTYAAVAEFPINVALITALWVLLGLPSSGIWVLFGTGLRRLLTEPTSVRIFNWTMAAALVASILPVLVDFRQ